MKPRYATLGEHIYNKIEDNEYLNELYEIIAKHSNQDVEKIWKDADRDYWLTSQEAKDYGMIDEILDRSKK